MPVRGHKPDRGALFHHARPQPASIPTRIREGSCQFHIYSVKSFMVSLAKKRYKEYGWVKTIVRPDHFQTLGHKARIPVDSPYSATSPSAGRYMEPRCNTTSEDS